jgi:hypothetical protein
MTSSISSSETPVDPKAVSEWRRWLVAFLSVPLLGICLIVTFLVAVDPYDTGKFGLLDIDGVDDGTTSTAIPSRARDAQFDSAVIGNSTVQALDPAELSRASGLRFVQLYKIGASPHEELAVLDLFVRHHPHPAALVIGADPYWCTHDETDPSRDFPYWLYDRSFFEYAVRLISWKTFEHAFQRLAIGLGLHRRAVVNGYFNYEEIWPPGPLREVAAPWQPAPAATTAERGVFPAIALLYAAIGKLPSDVRVVLFVPPLFHTKLPEPGSVATMERDACNAALAQVVAGRRNGKFINFRVDNALTRDPVNFVDFIHYHAPIAHKMSNDIVASLRSGAAARIEF